MDPSEIPMVRFHFGGKFIRIGPTVEYIEGKEVISKI
jgi:hypothetical protein